MVCLFDSLKTEARFSWHLAVNKLYVSLMAFNMEVNYLVENCIHACGLENLINLKYKTKNDCKVFK